MIIDLSSFLDNSDNYFSFEGELNEIESDLSERGITIVGAIEYEGETFRIDGEKAIEIRISFSYKEPCSRCLESSIHKMKSTLSGKLLEGKEKTDSEDENFDEKFYYKDDELNLKDYILNQVVLSLPMKSLCDKDCKGLCVLCGVDLNKNTCDCVQDEVDPRLEKLKNFFPKN